MHVKETRVVASNPEPSATAFVLVLLWVIKRHESIIGPLDSPCTSRTVIIPASSSPVLARAEPRHGTSCTAKEFAPIKVINGVNMSITHTLTPFGVLTTRRVLGCELQTQLHHFITRNDASVTHALTPFWVLAPRRVIGCEF